MKLAEPLRGSRRNSEANKPTNEEVILSDILPILGSFSPWPDWPEMVKYSDFTHISQNTTSSIFDQSAIKLAGD